MSVKIDKQEKTAKKRKLLEPTGDITKDVRLIELLEKELTLKKKKFEGGGGVDISLEKEIGKKLTTFITRCGVTAQYYYKRDETEFTDQCINMIQELGTEKSTLSTHTGSALNAAKLHHSSWEELSILYELMGESDKLATAQEHLSSCQDIIKTEKRQQRIAKARLAVALGPSTSSNNNILKVAMTSIINKSTDDVDEELLDPQLTSQSQLVCSPETAEDSDTSVGKVKRRRARKKLCEITEDNDDYLNQTVPHTEDSFLNETIPTIDQSEVATTEDTADPTTRKKRQKRLAEIRAANSTSLGSPVIESLLSVDCIEGEDEQKRVVTPQMLQHLTFPSSPQESHSKSPTAVLGPQLPPSMLLDAEKGEQHVLQGFDYLRGNGVPTVVPTAEWSTSKFKEITSAVVKGREAHFRMLTKNCKQHLTQHMIDRWLRAAATSGSSSLVKRLVTDFNASVSLADPVHQQTPLHWAAKAGHHLIISQLISLGADTEINKIDNNGRTPLHICCLRGDVDGANILLNVSTILVQIQDNLGNTPLQYATYNCMSDIEGVLVRHGALSNMYGIAESDNTLRFLEACKRGHQDVALLLSCHTGVDLATSDMTTHCTPLHYTCINILERVAARLLLSGISSDPINSLGQTPLHIAASKSLSLTLLLLANGSEPAVEDVHGNTTIHYACKGRKCEIASVLLNRSPKLRNHRNHGGETPLHRAVFESMYDFVTTLITKGANLNARDTTKNTPLHLACSGGESACAATLIHAGAALDLKNHSGYTPLLYAVSNRMSDVAIQLLVHGCNVNCVDKSGYGAMHYACANSLGAVCTELLKNPLLNVTARANNGITVLHFAAASNLKSVVETLLVRGCHVHALDHRKNTPLHFSCLHQCPDTSEYLISIGANPHTLNSSKKSPLDYALLASSDAPLTSMVAAKVNYSNQYKMKFHKKKETCDPIIESKDQPSVSGGEQQAAISLEEHNKISGSQNSSESLSRAAIRDEDESPEQDSPPPNVNSDCSPHTKSICQNSAESLSRAAIRDEDESPEQDNVNSDCSPHTKSICQNSAESLSRAAIRDEDESPEQDSPPPNVNSDCSPHTKSICQSSVELVHDTRSEEVIPDPRQRSDKVLSAPSGEYKPIAKPDCNVKSAFRPRSAEIASPRKLSAVPRNNSVILGHRPASAGFQGQRQSRPLSFHSLPPSSGSQKASVMRIPSLMSDENISDNVINLPLDGNIVENDLEEEEEDI